MKKPPLEVRIGGDPGGVPYREILRPKPGKEFEGVILSQHLVEIRTHFLIRGDNLKGETIPCTRHMGFCPGCHARRRRDWKGYLMVWCPLFPGQSIAELTPMAMASCPKVCDPKADLRSWRFVLGRVGGSKKNRCYFKIGEKFELKKGQLSEAVDVVEALCHIWGLTPKDGEDLRDDSDIPEV